MLPSNSNLSKENCSPTSSNCVIWQGPDISCINLCTGDSITDVTYKLAQEICELQNNIGVSNVNLTCLVEVCQRTAEPAKTLSNILNLLINKVCCLSDIIKEIPPPTEPYIEPVLNYPICNAFSPLVNDLHSDFTEQLALKICSLFTSVNTNTSNIADHETRIDALEVPKPKDKIDSCLLGVIEDYDKVLENLETEYCEVVEVLGDETLMNATIASQCPSLSTSPTLVDSKKTMIAAYPTWNATVSTFAESVQNLWLTVCDIRAAVRSILDNCCKAGCDDITIDFFQRWTDDGILQLNFRSKSNLPFGFYDCGMTPSSPSTGNNTLTFTDGKGYVYPHLVIPGFRSIDYPTNKEGILDDNNLYPFGWYEIDLELAGIDTATPITLTADLCFTDGTIECIKCYSFTIPPYTGKCCEIKATGDVTIMYRLCQPPNQV